MISQWRSIPGHGGRECDAGGVSGMPANHGVDSTPRKLNGDDQTGTFNLIHSFL
jgi:hypothetical protein